MSGASAAYGPYLAGYLKAELQDILDRRLEKRTGERPSREAKKYIKAKLKDRTLSPEKRENYNKALQALDDSDLNKLLEAAGVTVATVRVERVDGSS